MGVSKSVSGHICFYCGIQESSQNDVWAFLKAVAIVHDGNHVRSAANSAEAPEMHIRLNEAQLEQSMGEFHAFRDQVKARYVTSKWIMETFLHYISSCGYYYRV